MVTKRQVTTPEEPEPRQATIPPPVDGGTEYIESLGSWIDDLMGDARTRRAANQSLAHMFLSDGAAPADPPPAEPPAPVPAGTDVITKGGKLGGETR